jgi:hypothetical protein
MAIRNIQSYDLTTNIIGHGFRVNDLTPSIIQIRVRHSITLLFSDVITTRPGSLTESDSTRASNIALFI